MATYFTSLGFATLGRQRFGEIAKEHAGNPELVFKFSVGPFPVILNAPALSVSAGNEQELARQACVGLYGNFEALLADHVLAVFQARGGGDPENSTKLLLMNRAWRQKLEGTAEKLGLRYRSRDLLALYEGHVFNFFGKVLSDPIDFLQAVAHVRHRIVHSNGRVDGRFLADYPESGMKPGDLIPVPLEIPFLLWSFLLPLSDYVDRLFAEHFVWPREIVKPETLI